MAHPKQRITYSSNQVMPPISNLRWRSAFAGVEMCGGRVKWRAKHHNVFPAVYVFSTPLTSPTLDVFSIRHPSTFPRTPIFRSGLSPQRGYSLSGPRRIPPRRPHTPQHSPARLSSGRGYPRSGASPPVGPGVSPGVSPQTYSCGLFTVHNWVPSPRHHIPPPSTAPVHLPPPSTFIGSTSSPSSAPLYLHLRPSDTTIHDCLHARPKMH